MSTVFVPLTQGKVAIVDAEDYPLVTGRKWSLARRGDVCYAQTWERKGSGITILLMHRLVLNAPKGVEVDHRDGDGLNNRRGNLRLATSTQNKVNVGPRRKNRTGFKGVSWDESRRMFKVQLTFDHTHYNLGHYDDVEAAARAYDEKARELHGEYARLNFP